MNPPSKISQAETRKIKYGERIQKIARFCSMNKETVYSPGNLVNILGLDVSSLGLSISIRNRYRESSLLKLRVKREGGGGYTSYYGISDICGSRECFIGWCSDETRCRTGKGNDKLKVFNWKKKK